MTPITHVPAPVRARIPHGGKSRFYGSAPIGPKHSRIFLHFCEVPGKVRPIAANDTDPKDYVLDLFAYTGKGRNLHLRLLNSVLFNAMGEAGFDQLQVQTIWLVPNTRQTPVILLDCSFSGAFYGFWGDKNFIAFNNGLRRKPVAQSFHYGAYRDGSDMYDYTFDKRGVLAITSTIAQHVVDQPTQYITTQYNWNGHGWAQPEAPSAKPTPSPTAVPTPQQTTANVAAISPIPAAVRARIPKGGKSLVYGSAPIGPNHSPVFLHLYDTKKHAYKWSYGHGLKLDLWRRTVIKRTARLSLINNISVSAYAAPAVDLKILWLIPAKQQNPIIQMSSYDGGSDFVSLRDDTLIVLDGGVSAKPKIQSFDSSCSMSDCTSVSFDEVDDHGYLKVISSYAVGGNADNPEITELRWNGQKFAVFAKLTPTPTPIP